MCHIIFFRVTLNFVAAIFISISTICNSGVWYHVKNLKVFDDEDEKAQEMQVFNRVDEQKNNTERE